VYTLAPVSAGSGTRALRLTDREGAVYWLEYRTAAGQDSWLGLPAGSRFGLESGVLLRQAGGQPNTSLLLDGSPSPSTGWSTDMQVALPAGRPVALSGGDLHITVQSLTPSAATVEVGGPRSWIQAESLAPEQWLVSPQGRYRAGLGRYGNLVVSAADGRLVWTNRTLAVGARLAMQSDGNLVTYRRDGSASWHTRTSGTPGARLVLQDDGNLVIYRADGRPRWWTGSDDPRRLRPGQMLTAGQALVSRNGRYRAVVQSDGNLVVYGPSSRVVWASHRFTRQGRLVMQTDGNLVTYAADGRVLWHTWTHGNPRASLVLQDDGNLVLYRASGTPAWWTRPDPWR
jgi:hypothetical protein